MAHARISLALAVVWLLVGRGAAQEHVDERLAAMTRRAQTLKIVFPQTPNRAPPALSAQPVLRCSDPTREEEDGAVWLWLERSRPVAGLCIIHKRGKWNYELVSLTGEPLEVTGRPAWSWQPKSAEQTWVAVDDTVPNTPRTRQLAMRGVARRFAASEVRRGERFDLRLMDRPIYAYADSDQGILDGGLFAISYGTNPEVLLQIEARQVDGKPQWQVSFARLSAAELTVRLGDKEVWKTEPLAGESDYDPREPYYATNEPGSLE